MGNTIDTVLFCSNRSDELAAKENALIEAQMRAEEFKLEADQYKRQLDEVLLRSGNGILKKSESSKSIASINSGRRISKKITFDGEVAQPHYNEPMKTEKKSFVSSIFSRSFKKHDDVSPKLSPRLNTPLPPRSPRDTF